MYQARGEPQWLTAIVYGNMEIRTTSAAPRPSLSETQSSDICLPLLPFRPYDRTSRLSDCYDHQVAASVLPSVAVVAYNWESSSLVDLSAAVKGAAGPSGSVTSIAIMAPRGSDMHSMGGIGERGCNFERMFAFCIEFGQANMDDLDPADDRLTVAPLFHGLH